MDTARIALSLVIHNHQPVGNFGFVFEANHRRAYAPMLEALDRHPPVRVGLHYTGPLLEWLKVEEPGAIDLLRRLVARDQVEVLGGGYYEPVLASLPERDRLGQLRRMADEVESLVGRRPRGAWLAERVWEPDLPTSLVGAGHEYTVLDDAHLRAAGIPDERHWGAYSTDDQGRRLMIFGTEQGLRYRIPFRPVEEVIHYLREHATEAGDRVGVVGDDGEKFGAWPGTWDLCWGPEAWVDRFFEALEENRAWLTTLRPIDALREHAPAGRAYVPTGSYAEMGEWALPVEERREYTRVLHAAIAEGRPEARWMRGGFWRNFQVNYREINDLHKQMLRVSDEVAAVSASLGPSPGADEAARLARIVDHLYRGQSNDCYWHGLFGGIYLSHMRLATLAHLIAAEDGADRLSRTLAVGTRASDGPVVEIVDLDLDGNDEILVHGPGQVVAIKPGEGGGIGRWDVRAVRHALTSVVRRRPEAYHDTLLAIESGAAGSSAQGAISIHDIVEVTEPGLAGRLWYDGYERRSGLVHILPTGTSPDAFERAEHRELGDFVDRPFTIVRADTTGVELERAGHVVASGGRVVPVRVLKLFAFATDRRSPSLSLSFQVANEGETAVEALLAVEWGLNMLGGGANPAAWIEVAGRRGAFDTRLVVPATGALAMGNDAVGVTLESRAQPKAAAWWSSIETISLSEHGFERNHQGGCLLWVWPLRLAPGESMSVVMDNGISVSADRAEEEGL